MTQIDIKSLKKLYYSIGEVAQIFNINTSLIRFWEKEFKFEASKKSAKGNRLYTVKDIENFNKIYHLVKIEGFTLDGAKKSLKASKKSDAIDLHDGNTNEKDAIISKLESIKAKLLQLKN